MIHNRILFSNNFVVLAVMPSAARTLRVLAVGSSFSRDAVEQHLHELAMADGDTMIVGNLFIPGCSLERHVRCARNDSPRLCISQSPCRRKASRDQEYDSCPCSCRRALGLCGACKAVSPISGIYSTWSAWLPELKDYVKARVPKRQNSCYTRHGHIPVILDIAASEIMALQPGFHVPQHRGGCQ